MKRKFLDRLDWDDFVERRYLEVYEVNQDYEGYIALLYLDKVKKPFRVLTEEKSYCVIDTGYKWLQFAPKDEFYVVTTMIDDKGLVVKWYFDVIKRLGQENGRIYYDDLYLDVGYFPDGEIEVMDVDELDDALKQGIIGQNDHDLAHMVKDDLVRALGEGRIHLVNQTAHYLEVLERR